MGPLDCITGNRGTTPTIGTAPANSGVVCAFKYSVSYSSLGLMGTGPHSFSLQVGFAPPPSTPFFFNLNFFFPKANITENPRLKPRRGQKTCT